MFDLWLPREHAHRSTSTHPHAHVPDWPSCAQSRKPTLKPWFIGKQLIHEGEEAHRAGCFFQESPYGLAPQGPGSAERPRAAWRAVSTQGQSRTHLPVYVSKAHDQGGEVLRSSCALSQGDPSAPASKASGDWKQTRGRVSR